MGDSSGCFRPCGGETAAPLSSKPRRAGQTVPLIKYLPYKHQDPRLPLEPSGKARHAGTLVILGQGGEKGEPWGRLAHYLSLLSKFQGRERLSKMDGSYREQVEVSSASTLHTQVYTRAHEHVHTCAFLQRKNGTRKSLYTPGLLEGHNVIVFSLQYKPPPNSPKVTRHSPFTRPSHNKFFTCLATTT